MCPLTGIEIEIGGNKEEMWGLKKKECHKPSLRDDELPSETGAVTSRPNYVLSTDPESTPTCRRRLIPRPPQLFPHQLALRN